ncbi:unnamed protein product [Heterosigma akashiwo]
MRRSAGWGGGAAGGRDRQRREQIVRVLEGMNCAVFLPALDRTHYHGFCKQLLWRLFWRGPARADQQPLDSAVTGEGAGEAAPAAGASGWDQQRYQEWYAAYKEVNQMIADVVNPMIKPGDVVWTHDYHLMLVPKADRPRCGDLTASRR